MSYDAVNNLLSVAWAGKSFDNLGNVTITYGIIGIGDCGDLNLTVEGTRWEENSHTIGLDSRLYAMPICHCDVIFPLCGLRLIDTVSTDIFFSLTH